RIEPRSNDNDESRQGLIVVVVPFQIVEVQLAEKIREGAEIGLFRQIIGEPLVRLALELSGDLFLRLDGSAVHHRIGDIDRDVQAYTQRDGIAGPGVDFNLAVLRLDDHPGKEDIVAQVVDDNALHRTAKLKDDGFQQV